MYLYFLVYLKSHGQHGWACGQLLYEKIHMSNQIINHDATPILYDIYYLFKL